MSDSVGESFEVQSHTKLVSSIEQILKRTFSYELEELVRCCGADKYNLLDQLIINVSGDSLKVLDDIQSIILKNSFHNVSF